MNSGHGTAARRAAERVEPLTRMGCRHGNANLWPVVPVESGIAREREASADDQRGSD